MADQGDDFAEAVNNQRSEHLSQKVALLKNFAVDIENETRRHNRLLDGMDTDFDANLTFLSGTRKRLNRMIKSKRNCRFTCYLALGISVAFFIIYFIISWRM